MSVDAFRNAVKVHVPNKNDQTWFPRWLARYAEGRDSTGEATGQAIVIWSLRSQRNGSNKGLPPGNSFRQFKPSSVVGSSSEVGPTALEDMRRIFPCLASRTSVRRGGFADSLDH